jgi:hypothetical protein
LLLAVLAPKPNRNALLGAGSELGGGALVAAEPNEKGAVVAFPNELDVNGEMDWPNVAAVPFSGLLLSSSASSSSSPSASPSSSPASTSSSSSSSSSFPNLEKKPFDGKEKVGCPGSREAGGAAVEVELEGNADPAKEKPPPTGALGNVNVGADAVAAALGAAGKAGIGFSIFEVGVVIAGAVEKELDVVGDGVNENSGVLTVVAGLDTTADELTDELLSARFFVPTLFSSVSLRNSSYFDCILFIVSDRFANGSRSSSDSINFAS